MLFNLLLMDKKKLILRILLVKKYYKKSKLIVDVNYIFVNIVLYCFLGHPFLFLSELLKVLFVKVINYYY